MIRAVVLVLVVALTYNFVEPGVKAHAAPAGEAKTFDTNYKLDPLKSASMYRIPVSYTIGAIRNSRRVSGVRLNSGGVAYVNGRRITIRYGRRIGSYMQQRNSVKWLRNQSSAG